MCILCDYWSSNVQMNFVFVWPLIIFSHTKHVFGGVFSHIQLTIKWSKVLISVTICYLKWRNVYFVWLFIIQWPHEFCFFVAFMFVLVISHIQLQIKWPKRLISVTIWCMFKMKKCVLSYVTICTWFWLHLNNVWQTFSVTIYDIWSYYLK